MDAKRWQEVKRIYESAVVLDPVHRDAFVKEACAGDDSLRKEVESFLAHGHQADGYLEQPALEMAARGLAEDSNPGTADLTGRTFLHYRITGKLGAGGMGVVYRAQDVRLGRDVALKFLSGGLSSDPQALGRFQREARAASALNHPNICTLHDIGEHDGRTFLVMEHLAGETLAHRLHKGPLHLDQALETCAHIADALDAAHKQGIVHRDLKPGNIMLTKTGPKLLDFGLAKLKKETALPEETEGTRSASLTESGMIMGTVPYMAPEQLEGRAVDARTDIWALGVILYEMISGKRAFEGPSQASLIAAILERDPAPLKDVQPLTPPLLDRVVKKCLAKNPDARWDSAHDIADELRWIRESGAAALPVSEIAHYPGRWKWTMIGSLILLTLAMAAITLVVAMRRSAAPQTIERFTGVLPEELRLTGLALAISPDGRMLVFSASATGKAQLFIRRIDEYEARPLQGTEDAMSAFFPPDGQWVGYFVMGKGLQKIRVDGGPPMPICAANFEYYGADWGADDTIIFGGWMTEGLSKVRSQGDTFHTIKKPAQADSNTWYIWPQLLPGGEKLLFTIYRDGQASIAVLSLGTGEIRNLLNSASHGRYLPNSGHLIYESEGNLVAASFDPKKLEMRGREVAVIEGICHGVLTPCFDVSANGTLIYLPAAGSFPSLEWRDRSGCTVPLNFTRRPYFEPTISPDGRLFADTITDLSIRSIWIGSVAGEPLKRLTPFGNESFGPVFTPDSKTVFFASAENNRYNIFQIPADGSGKPERVTDSPHPKAPTSVSPDGRIVLYNDIDRDNGDIWQVEIGRPSTARPYITSTKNELSGRFSPDQRWVAYQSDISGKMEVYIQSYPVLGAPELVSIGGGKAPAWNPMGGELFYEGQNGIISRRIEQGHATGPPTQLFAHRSAGFASGDWAVSNDGRRFLFAESPRFKSEINIVTNWLEDLKARAPAGKK